MLQTETKKGGTVVPPPNLQIRSDQKFNSQHITAKNLRGRARTSIHTREEALIDVSRVDDNYMKRLLPFQLTEGLTRQLKFTFYLAEGPLTMPAHPATLPSGPMNDSNCCTSLRTHRQSTLYCQEGLRLAFMALVDCVYTSQSNSVYRYGWRAAYLRGRRSRTFRATTGPECSLVWFSVYRYG